MPISPSDLLVPFACVLGAFVGSFLNVCIYRLPRENLHIFRPAWSRCTFCLTTIRWHDNIPVLSWLLLGGRCRDCKSPIGVIYPLVEILTSVLFGLAAWRATHLPPDLAREIDLPWEQGVLFAVQAFLLGSLIVSTFIDIELRIIPDELTWLGMGLAPVVGAAFPFLFGELPKPGAGAFAGMFFQRYPQLYTFLGDHPHLRGLLQALLGMLTGGGSIWAVGFLGRLAFKKEAMGFGDVKYMAFLGGFLGASYILVTFVIAAMVGAVCGVLSFLVTRDRTMPFGPYLSVGALVMLLGPDEAAGLYYRLVGCFTRLISPR